MANSQKSHSEVHSTPGMNIGTAFKAGIAINVIFIIVESVYGFLSDSMALVSDAGHNFSDVLGLAISWIAILISQHKPTNRFTYGFRRSTILAALLNSLLLLGAVGFIVYENIIRINKSFDVNSSNVIIIASIGIVVNGFTAWLFMNKRHDLNIRSAFLHFLSDALVSSGVVIAGVLIFFTGAQWIDTVVSFLIIIFILYSTYRLLIDSLNLALDAVPENIDSRDVREFFMSLPEVCDIHDLHIWAMSTTETALTVHLATCKPTDMRFMNMVQDQLHKKFGLDHTTIQIEYGENNRECKTNC
ncbi:MAG TPA: cation diffusion facilitator family transporter [Bacteroidales bacterium]|nr:cation diffusion facilitator family transporter [Bacteroidales bacterium]